MFCTHCGKELPDNLKFCTECGAKLRGNEEAPVQQKEMPDQAEKFEQVTEQQGLSQGLEQGVAQDQTFGSQPEDLQAKRMAGLAPEETGKKKSKLPLVIAGIAALLICVIGVGIFSVFALSRQQKINLNDYLTIEVEGYDMIGTATAEFDQKKFTKDYGKTLYQMTGGGRKALTGFSKIMAMLPFAKTGDDKEQEKVVKNFIKDCVGGNLDKTENISNGDSITYSWDVDEEKALKNYGVLVRTADIIVNAEGLKEADKMDPFEEMEITFSGRDGEGVADVYSRINGITFTVNPSDNLSNGQMVTVEACVEDINEFVRENKKIPILMKKEIAVEGLSMFAGSIDSFSKESMTLLQDKAKSAFDMTTGDLLSPYSEKLIDFEYIGNYYLTSKYDYENDNKCYLMYLVTVEDYDDARDYDEMFKYIWYAEFSNLEVDAEGNLTGDLQDCLTPSNTIRVYKDKSGSDVYASWYYFGYFTLEDFLAELKKDYSDYYNIEENVEKNLARTGNDA